MQKDERLVFDAGQRYLRNKGIDEQLELIEEKLQQTDCADHQAFLYLQGKEDALLFARNATHEHLIDSIVKTKKVLLDIDNSDYFDFESAYIEGYLNGLETVAYYNRKVFSEKVTLLLIVFSKEPEFIERYTLALQTTPQIQPFPAETSVQYLFVSSVEELNQALCQFSSLQKKEENHAMEYSVLMHYSPGNAPSLEELNSMDPERMFFFSGTTSPNALNNINKLLKASAL